METDPREASSAEPAAEAPPAPTRLARLVSAARRAFVYMRETYCRMDPRTAGLFRIVVGFLVATDMMRHWWVARVFYSNEGVLKNHYNLFRAGGYSFSVFNAFSSMGEVHAIFAVGVLCGLCLMIGWHARLFAVACFILETGLDHRLLLVENGGYVVVNLVTMYAMFLPIERRFSVDAWRRSYRERRERTVADLNAHRQPAWATDDHVSLAVFLVTLNLAVVYFFNVINKSGEVWRFGETIHYVLYLNRMVTGIGVFLREHVPLWLERPMTWYVVAHEALLVPWILWPEARRLTRTLALFGIWTLHVAFGTVFRLGPFSWFMIGWSFTIIAREQWAMLEARHLRRARPRVVVYDRGSPLAFALMRALGRLDGLELLRFEESAADDGSPPLLAARDEEGHVTTGSAAVREIAQALPGGRFACPILGPLASALLAFAARRRVGLARFFGLDGLDAPPRAQERPAGASPLRAALVRWRVRAREGLLAYFAVCAVFQAIIENKSIPPFIRDHLKMPTLMQATIGYPRLYQGWGMFAPNPITDDGSITVDARTIDGRRIDPFTGEPPDLVLTDARGLGLGQIQQDYFNRIRLDHNSTYRQGLQEYLQQWHLQTGRAEDEIVSFDVYWVRAECPVPCRLPHVSVCGGWARFRPVVSDVRYVPGQCPAPDKTRMYANENLALLSWRKPGYRPPAGQAPLPPLPKIESGETKQPDVKSDCPVGDRFRLPLPVYFK